MGVQTVGVCMTKDEQDQFNQWSKEQIYEAYLVEHRAKVVLNKEVNRLARQLAEIKFMAGKR